MENENMTPQPEQQWFYPPQPLMQPEIQPEVQPPVPQEQPVMQPPEPPAYQPEQPAYQPEQPAYQPEQPAYQPKQPVYQPEAPELPPEPQKKKTAKWKIIVPIVAGVLVLAVLAGVYFFFLRGHDGVVGTWRFDGGFIDDADVEEADATLYVNKDHTGKIVIDGKETAFTWRPTENTDGEERFELLAEDGTRCTLRLFTDPEDPYCGDLLLYGNDENMLYFTR